MLPPSNWKSLRVITFSYQERIAQIAYYRDIAKNTLKKRTIFNKTLRQNETSYTLPYDSVDDLLFDWIRQNDNKAWREDIIISSMQMREIMEREIRNTHSFETSLIATPDFDALDFGSLLFFKRKSFPVPVISMPIHIYGDIEYLLQGSMTYSYDVRIYESLHKTLMQIPRTAHFI